MPTPHRRPSFTAEMLDERRDVETMLDLDPDTTDSEMQYRFVHDDRMNVSRKRMRGYRPVTKEDGVRTLVEVDDSADGLIRVGDTILMMCPKDKYKRRKKAQREFSEGRLGTPKTRVKDLARDSKVKVIENEEG